MRLLLFFAVVGLAYGQLDSNTITVTASRTARLLPDQVIIGVYVDANLATSLDDIVGAFPGAGLSAANLSGVYTLLDQRLEWSFTITVPFSKIQETLTSLSATQNSAAAAKNGLSLWYYLQGSSISPALQAAHPCSLPTLLADAQAQAQKVAAVTGMSAGAVVSMSDGGATIAPTTVFSFVAVIPATLPLTGKFSLAANSPALPPCSLVVKFQLR